MNNREVMQQALEALESGLAFAADAPVLQNLRTALEQPEPPPEWEVIKNILSEYGLDAIAFVANWKAAQQQAEPWGWYSAKADDFMTHSIRKEHERLGSHTFKNGKFDLPLYTHPAVGSQTQGEEQ